MLLSLLGRCCASSFATLLFTPSIFPVLPLQDNNVIVRTFGTPREELKLYNHVDLVQLLDIVNLEAGTAVAGGPPEVGN